MVPCANRNNKTGLKTLMHKIEKEMCGLMTYLHYISVTAVQKFRFLFYFLNLLRYLCSIMRCRCRQHHCHNSSCATEPRTK